MAVNNIKKQILFFLLILLGAGSLFASNMWRSGVGKNLFNGSSLENVRMIRDRDGSVAICLGDNEYKPDNGTELLLHFNSSTGAAMFRGEKYRFNKGDYIIDRLNPFWGSGSLKFLFPKHKFVFTPVGKALLNEAVDIGSFTIEFFMYPYSNYDNEEIFSKYGTYIDKNAVFRRGGVRAYLKKGRLVWDFRNFFRDNNGKMYNYQLSGSARSLRRRWQHQAVTYDHFSGKLTHWVDGVENAVLWATDTGRYGGSPLIPAFPKNLKRYPVLGRSFLGKLDEFRISRVARARFHINKYKTARGVVTSRVMDMGATGSKMQSISWGQFCPAGSAIFMEYRISDTIFLRDSNVLPWKRVRNGQKFSGQVSGRYIQWRAQLHGVQRGRFSPVLRDVTFRFEKTEKPLQPVGLRVVPGNGKLFLRWTGNGDRVDGYRIYIGTEKGEYLHPQSPITVSMERLDRLRPEYVVYGLENDRLYYISIVAYVTKGKGHQSPFSQEVYARPSALYSR